MNLYGQMVPAVYVEHAFAFLTPEICDGSAGSRSQRFIAAYTFGILAHCEMYVVHVFQPSSHHHVVHSLCLVGGVLVAPNIHRSRKAEVAVDLFLYDEFLDGLYVRYFEFRKLDGGLDAESLNVHGDVAVEIGTKMTA